MIYYTVYKITNTINNKIYIGIHQTSNLHDRYMGSGTYLRRAQNKYGIQNFSKEILFTYDNIDDMLDKERELVTLEFVNQANTYNLIEGGPDNITYINRRKLNLYGKNGRTPNVTDNLARGKETQRRLYATDPEWCEHRSNQISAAAHRHYAGGGHNPFKGKVHTEDTKRQIGEKNSAYQTGSGNSQFGTRWIHSLVEQKSKKIPKEAELPDGWLEGRKIKFGE